MAAFFITWLAWRFLEAECLRMLCNIEELIRKHEQDVRIFLSSAANFHTTYECVLLQFT